jgi:hypothetical protein
MCGRIDVLLVLRAHYKDVLVDSGSSGAALSDIGFFAVGRQRRRTHLLEFRIKHHVDTADRALVHNADARQRLAGRSSADTESALWTSPRHETGGDDFTSACSARAGRYVNLTRQTKRTLLRALGRTFGIPKCLTIRSAGGLAVQRVRVGGSPSAMSAATT